MSTSRFTDDNLLLFSFTFPLDIVTLSLQLKEAILVMVNIICQMQVFLDEDVRFFCDTISNVKVSNTKYYFQFMRKEDTVLFITLEMNILIDDKGQFISKEINKFTINSTVKNIISCLF